MNVKQMIITVILLAVSVWLTRFLPFLIFKNTDRLPKIIEYLGKVLPAAMMGLLVIYCFKDYDFKEVTNIAPAVISAAAVALLQWFKKNTVLSIFAGTVLYMVLIRVTGYIF